MNKHITISEELIAPCGVNCAICSKYLSYIHNLNRSQRGGCRASKDSCSYLFDKCTGINGRSKSDAVYCFECDQYPCKQIDRMDDRYRKNYLMSVKDNLEFIRKSGTDEFVSAQCKKYQCSKCGGLISIHNGKCFKCDDVSRLVQTSNKRY